MATCYRHPSRETGVACSSCGRPICPDCMTPTPVGMRCPECARERTKVRTARQLRRGGEPVATYILIAINVAAFLGSSSGGFSVGSNESGSVYLHGALFGPAIDHQHEYWRLITSGFLHANLLHILFNMYFIYVIGTMLEPAIGTIRFVAVYFTSLLVGSFGALLFTPDAFTVGA
jgi:membrane associated rhomboid family serine protease